MEIIASVLAGSGIREDFGKISRIQKMPRKVGILEPTET
jgi:hypothetical protein